MNGEKYRAKLNIMFNLKAWFYSIWSDHWLIMVKYK